MMYGQTKETESPPNTGRRFYSIVENDDGTVDVYLNPFLIPMTTEEGFTDYDITVIVVRDVDPGDERFGGDLEAHIRANYEAWCEAGQKIDL